MTDTTYGDAKIADAHSLAVVIEARRALAQLHAEDDFSGQPRRAFGPAELEEVYERAQERVDQRKRVREPSEPEPIGKFVDDIKATILDPILARMAPLACEGRLDRLSACTNVIAESCGERDAPFCPRQIARYDRARARSQQQPVNDFERLIAWGVTEDVAEFVGPKPGMLQPKFHDGIDAVRHARTWLEQPDVPTLVLAGGTGNGKSSAAAWAMLQAGGGLWVSAYAVHAKARDPGYLDRLCEAPLLVVDELGGEEASESMKTAVGKLAYERGRKRTIWTLNIDAGAAKDRYTERFTSRLKVGIAKLCEGESLRGRAGGAR